MNASQRIMQEVIVKYQAFMKNIDKPVRVPELTSENIEDEFRRLHREDDTGWVWEHQEEFRCSGQPSGLEAEYGRYYEPTAVAAKLSDGSWVGWTYWHGGGKHGEPSQVPWLEDAYDLEMTEKMEVVRHFARKEAE